MSDIAIRAKLLGKQYRLGSAAKRTAYDAIVSALRAPFRLRGAQQRSGAAEMIWALRNVTFDLYRGEVLGVIGRNGAGKSTLLKILSRITGPSEGLVDLYGRVTSLLEVGTGFHPELTGRENIFLNGAILGMRRAEIIRNFDEIVAFAEIARFLDTPVKHYSSGMYLRLAFAVAAHLDPEILIVDEVLAVGDVAFQKKCLGKMGEVAKGGRTILFVSHNLPAVLHLCSRALLLDAGNVVADGSVAEVVDRYLNDLTAAAGISIDQRRDRQGNRRLVFLGFALLAAEREQLLSQVLTGQALRILLAYDSTGSAPLKNVHVALGIYGRHDEKLLHLSTGLVEEDFGSIPARGALVCHIPRLPLQPGRYKVNLWVSVEGELADWVQAAAHIDVVPGDFFGSGRLPPADQGYVLTDHSWGCDQNLLRLFHPVDRSTAV
jgi:lipopolysaccharide transport system ATP-binding protein